MPKKYEEILKSHLARGKSRDEAQSIAAAIYNAQRKPGQAPVTGPERPRRRKRKR